VMVERPVLPVVPTVANVASAQGWLDALHTEPSRRRGV
jgi:hypothetical protein